MIHIFETECEQRFFCADDVSECVADLLKDGHDMDDFRIDSQPPGTECRSTFTVTKKSGDNAYKDTRFSVTIQRLES